MTRTISVADFRLLNIGICESSLLNITVTSISSTSNVNISNSWDCVSAFRTNAHRST